MPENILLLIFYFVLVFILAIFRKQLTFEIKGISLLILNTTKPGSWLYTIVFLPGTIIHELSHYLMAEVLRVKTGKITIFPGEEIEGEKSLGSIETIKTDPIRGFFIGISPLITGTISLIVLARLLGDVWAVKTPFWQTALLVYAVIVFSNSMLTSKSDRRYWPFMAVLSLGLYFLFQQIQLTPPERLQPLINQTLKTINSALILAFFLELSLIVVLFSLRLALERITNRRLQKN